MSGPRDAALHPRAGRGADSPVVSVIIPFYKQDKYLAATVASVREQGYAHCEIIIVDDGSPTPASEVLGEPDNLQLFRTENQGVSSARNTGAAHSTGEYLLFLDADDLLLPGAVEAHIKALARAPQASLCFGARREIEANGAVLRTDHVCRPRRNYFHTLLESNPLGNPGACLLRAEAFRAVGGFDESLRMAEDYDLWLKLARLGPVVRHTSPVLAYRRHGNNVSSDHAAMLASTLLVLDSLAPQLAPKDRARIAHARRRWRHIFLPRTDLRYKLAGVYYGLRAMATVDWRAQ